MKINSYYDGFLRLLLFGCILFFVNEEALAQTLGVIKGTVLDATTREPMIGVNVVEKGTHNATVTDFEGNFSLSNVKSGATITFTYVGYVDQALPAEKVKVLFY